MAIEIEQRFVITAPAEQVWEFLTDPHRVAGCLPGAAITEQEDDRVFSGTMKVKVGPVATSYKGKVRFERLDRAAWTVELTASGQDVRGKGGADMRMTSQLTEQPGGETEVAVQSKVSITGILAQMGRGMIQDVSDQMFQQFTACMRAELESGAPEPAVAGAPTVPTAGRPEAAPEALDLGSLGAAAGKQALGRLVRRPGLWAAVAILALVLYWLGFR